MLLSCCVLPGIFILPIRLVTFVLMNIIMYYTEVMLLMYYAYVHTSICACINLCICTYTSPVSPHTYTYNFNALIIVTCNKHIINKPFTDEDFVSILVVPACKEFDM